MKKERGTFYSQLELARAEFVRQVYPNDKFMRNPRIQEQSDSRLIQEDHRAMSNLPMYGYQMQWDPDAKMETLGHEDLGVD